MKIFVTGATGQLGHDVLHELVRRGHTAIASGRAPTCDTLPAGSEYVPLDLTDASSLEEALRARQPDAVIHCAAWTAVDAAEAPENRAAVFAANVTATEQIAAVCRELGCKMMYISTDYVFSGTGTRPWQPDGDECCPRNVYGQSKRAGELAVAKLLERYFIVRVSWTYGRNGSNFVKTMLRLGQTHPELRVVNDQIGTPTYTADLARLLADMIETERYGYYHAANGGGYISWYDFACAIFRQAGYSTRVSPVSTEEYGQGGAPRPRNSRMDLSRLAENGFEPLPDWDDALARFLKDIRR